MSWFDVHTTEGNRIKTKLPKFKPPMIREDDLIVDETTQHVEEIKTITDEEVDGVFSDYDGVQNED